MIRDVIQYIGETTWPQIGLVLFMLLFAGLLVWTLAGRKDRFRHQSRLPLEDGSGDSDDTDTENLTNASRGSKDER